MSDYAKGRKSKEMTRKINEEVNIFETKIKNIRELMIDAIKYDYDKLIGELNMEKRLDIEKIEIKLQKLKISQILLDTMKKSVISEKCLHHISRHRRYCV